LLGPVPRLDGPGGPGGGGKSVGPHVQARSSCVAPWAQEGTASSRGVVGLMDGYSMGGPPWLALSIEIAGSDRSTALSARSRSPRSVAVSPNRPAQMTPCCRPDNAIHEGVGNPSATVSRAKTVRAVIESPPPALQRSLAGPRTLSPPRSMIASTWAAGRG
jgi:hypothetical protein